MGSISTHRYICHFKKMFSLPHFLCCLTSLFPLETKLENCSLQASQYQAPYSFYFLLTCFPPYLSSFSRKQYNLFIYYIVSIALGCKIHNGSNFNLSFSLKFPSGLHLLQAYKTPSINVCSSTCLLLF